MIPSAAQRFARIRSLNVQRCCLVCCVVLLGDWQAAGLGQEPVVRYSFDEPSGTARDSGLPPAADGVLGPDTTRTTNTPGGASPFALDLSAPGADSFLNAGDVAKVDTLESFTLTTWLYLEGLNSDQGGSGNVRLLAKQAGNATFDGFSWNINTPNLGERTIDNFTLGLFVGGENGFAFARADEDVGAANAWTFLAVTYDGLGSISNVEFFVGDESNETAPLGNPGSIFSGALASTSGLANFGIGFTDAAPGLDFAADGFQDDVRVYDSVLTLDELEAVRLENLMAFAPSCDFNGDGQCNVADADALTAVGDLTLGVAVPPADAIFDLTGDGTVDEADLDQFLVDAATENGLASPYLAGDADLDGNVDFPDFLVLSSRFLSSATEGVWSLGDFDGNGVVAFPDFLALSDNFGHDSAVAAVVPEPTPAITFVLGTLLICGWYRIRRKAPVLESCSKIE